MPPSMEDMIRQKLAQALHPLRLDVENQSALHAGHMGDDGSGESHFKVVVVSSAFNGMSRIARQRQVYALLEEEMKRIHALALSTISEDEYDRV
jgi:BolA family transcriptional regulator, general stress-responsive regulator